MVSRVAFSQSVAHVTKISRCVRLAGMVVPTRSLMLVLAFCALAMLVAMPGWSQTSAAQNADFSNGTAFVAIPE